MLRDRWLSVPENGRTTYEAIATAAAGTGEQKVEKSSDDSNLEEEFTGDVGVESSEKSGIAQPKNFQLQTLLAGATPETLEESVEKGIELVENLKTPMLEKAPHAPDAARWLQQIGK